jgi:hypothetical protein
MKLLDDIDDLLAYLEDTAHGEEGKRITEMRNRIHTELSNSHKPVIMQGLTDIGLLKILHEVRLGRMSAAEAFHKIKGSPTVGQRGVGTNAEGEELLCFCANGGREGLHGICTNCGNYVGSSREGHL